MKILMATAEENPKQVMQSVNANCDARIVKPVHTVNLLAQMRHMTLAAQ